MIIPIELRFKADKDSKSAFRTDKTIKSHDVNSVEFHITIDGLELTDNHTAKILSIFHSSKSQANVECEIVEGKIIYKPDTNLISRHEHVTNYVYVYHNNQSLDLCEFLYTVSLSKIDETSLKVKEVYDQSYADLLADFEQALSDYKDTLPQADSVRADIDEMLNQVTNQAVADWEQGADALLDTVEDNESERVSAESTREISETDRVSSESNRKTNETTRISNEDARKSAEIIRLASEVDRINAETIRAEFYEGFDGEVATLKTEIAKKANRQQEGWITPALLNGFSGNLKYRKTQFGELQLVGTLISPVNIHGEVKKIFEFTLDYRVGWGNTFHFIAPTRSFYGVEESKFVWNNYERALQVGSIGTNTYYINVTIPMEVS